MREAILHNPAMLLLMVFNLVIIALATFGIVTTNHRAEEAAEGGRVVINCVLSMMEDHRLNSYHHYLGQDPAASFPAPEPPRMFELAVEEECASLFQGVIHKGAN